MSATLDRASQLALRFLKELGEPPAPPAHPLVQLAELAAEGGVLEMLYELDYRPSAVELVVPDWAALDSGEVPLDRQLRQLATRLERLSAREAARVLAGNVADSLRQKYPDFDPR